MTTAKSYATCLWFDREAEDAANYYCSVLDDARITAVSRYGKGAPLPEGTALTVAFELGSQRYLLLNGGPIFKLSEAVSIVVDCETQAEIDMLWQRLSEGGAESRCGWLKDRFGVSWQIVPKDLKRMMSTGEPRRIGAMFQAFMKMGKPDIAGLKTAYDAA